MATLLTRRLEDLARQDDTLEPLQAQWAFDRRLAGKALQNVGNLFPHYSRHDESHSIQILINIERVLGAERIERLSASDIWLLMEAAYLHEIGMVVGHKEKIEHWESGDIIKFARDFLPYARGPQHDLIKRILNNENFRVFDGGEHPLVQINLFQQFLAEYYRRKHPERATQITISPDDLIGLKSPRTELIPKRLFRLLGEISAVHGKGYKELMQLPHVASGIGRDKIHPRFIACMLRLGDLLDLDDNRFCPVMLAISGDLPSVSQAHLDKHHAVRHLRVDRERIEVHAICKTYESFVESENWFDYLRQEVAWQMAHWADIVPSESFGLLPTVGDIKTELSGYELVENQSRPRFQLDQPKVMELLQGAGLYEHPQDAFRELIQNAIDATLLYIWLKHGEGEAEDVSEAEKLTCADNPYGDKVRRVLNKYPINVKIRKLNADQPGDCDFLINISDCGIGIGRDDLMSMMRVGGSYLNSWKQEIHNRMPVWMRPSGTFGIGLQSAFLLGDEINFQTKSLRTGEQLSIRMSNPTGPESGAIYIERGTNVGIAKSPGTTLELRLKSQVSKRFVRGGAVNEYYDPMVLREPDFFRKIFDHSPLPVIVNGLLICENEENLKWNYLPEFGMAVAIDVASRGVPVFFYKSQSVSNRFLRIHLPCKVYVNIFTPAEETVAINRNSLRDDFQRGCLNEAIIYALKREFKNAEGNRNKALLSATLLILGVPISADYLSCRWQESGNYGSRNYFWIEDRRKATFPTIEEVLNENLELYQRFGDYTARHIKVNGRFHSCINNTVKLFFYAAENKGLNGVMRRIDKEGMVVGLSKTADAWDVDTLLQFVDANLIPSLRLAIPVISEYKELASLKWSSSLGENSRAPYCPGRSYMYFPFIQIGQEIRTENLEQLVSWTYENRFERDVELETIRSKYLDLINLVDEKMKANKRWGKMRAQP